LNRPTYQVSSGYTFTAELYERERGFNDALSRQNFLFSGSFQTTPRLRLTVLDSFALDRNTNRVASQAFASGRQESWSNTFTPGMAWQITPRTTWTVSATYGVLRFVGTGLGSGNVDSDTYGLQSYLGHVLTPRLTGTI